MTESTDRPFDDAADGPRHRAAGDVHDEPDALQDPDIDAIGDPEVSPEVGHQADPYELRSMPAQSGGSDDDPASYLNF